MLFVWIFIPMINSSCLLSDSISFSFSISYFSRLVLLCIEPISVFCNLVLVIWFDFIIWLFSFVLRSWLLCFDYIIWLLVFDFVIWFLDLIIWLDYVIYFWFLVFIFDSFFSSLFLSRQSFSSYYSSISSSLLSSFYLSYSFSLLSYSFFIISISNKLYLCYFLLFSNLLSGFLFMNIWCCVDCYIIEVVNLSLNFVSWFLVLVILLVSSCVILCSIDYLSIMDSYLFLIYLSMFQLIMIIFVLSGDLMITLVGWDWLGLISYLLINFWSSNIKSGIKAVVYNQVGDVCFLMILAFSYSFIPFINYSPFLSFNLVMIYISIFSFEWMIFLSFLFIIIFFSNSAQLPLSSWLLNAMSAPTPVSSLLHSSTMVIAGVYLGIIIQPIILVMIDSYVLMMLILVTVSLYSLIWSVIKAISLSDINSIIAFSTISQISYMFLSILNIILVPIYHIIIHALFKSLLFLLSGSLIHSEYNFQCIYSLNINYYFINISFILASSVLILSLSNECIIHNVNYILSSIFITIFSVLGGIFTMIYSMNIYGYIYYAPLRSIYSRYLVEGRRQLSFILPLLTISSIFIDQSLIYFFSISSSIMLNTIDSFSLISIDYILDFSVIFIVFSYSIIILVLLFSFDYLIWFWLSYFDLVISFDYLILFFSFVFWLIYGFSYLVMWFSFVIMIFWLGFVIWLCDLVLWFSYLILFLDLVIWLSDLIIGSIFVIWLLVFDYLFIFFFIVFDWMISCSYPIYWLIYFSYFILLFSLLFCNLVI